MGIVNLVLPFFIHANNFHLAFTIPSLSLSVSLFRISRDIYIFVKHSRVSEGEAHSRRDFVSKGRRHILDVIDISRYNHNRSTSWIESYATGAQQLARTHALFYILHLFYLNPFHVPVSLHCAL